MSTQGRWRRVCVCANEVPVGEDFNEGVFDEGVFAKEEPGGEDIDEGVCSNAEPGAEEIDEGVCANAEPRGEDIDKDCEQTCGVPSTSDLIGMLRDAMGADEEPGDDN